MLIPKKHEKLSTNLLVLGADILAFIKNNPCNLEELFQKLKKDKSIDLDQYYNSLTFLWLAEYIEISHHQVIFKVQHVTS